MGRWDSSVQYRMLDFQHSTLLNRKLFATAAQSCQIRAILPILVLAYFYINRGSPSLEGGHRNLDGKLEIERRNLEELLSREREEFLREPKSLSHLPSPIPLRRRLAFSAYNHMKKGFSFNVFFAYYISFLILL